MKILAALALGIYASFMATPQENLPTAEQYKTAWNHTLVNAKDKQEVRIVDLKGKYKAIVIDAFASWCGPCQALIPEVNAMHAKYGKKGVLFIGLNVQDEWSAMQKNIDSKSIQYLVLHDPTEGSAMMQNLRIPAIPMAIVLDGATLEEKGRFLGNRPTHKEGQLKLLAELGVEVD
jgi:thiol-disulfide isomerase/thioredoxin